MKKLLAFALIAMMAGSAMAAVGWFSDYILVSENGAADGYYWIGSDPSFGDQFTAQAFFHSLADFLIFSFSLFSPFYETILGYIKKECLNNIFF